MNFKQAYQRNF